MFYIRSMPESDEDDRYGTPIGLPREMWPEPLKPRTWEAEVEGFYFGKKARRGKR